MSMVISPRGQWPANYHVSKLHYYAVAGQRFSETEN